MHDLSSIFNSFAAEQVCAYGVAVDKLLVNASVPVAIVPVAEADTVMIEIDAETEDLKRFDIRVANGVLAIVETPPAEKGSITTGRSVVVVNGRVMSNTTLGTGRRQPRVIIHVPEGVALDADIKGLGIVESHVAHGAGVVTLSEQAKGKIKHFASLQAIVSGQSVLKTTVRGGGADLAASGQSEISLTGAFASVSSIASGQSSIATHGDVRGDVRAQASGMATILHTGAVAGQVSRHCSGMAKIII